MRGATCDSTARALPIHRIVPSATAPATRSRRGASAATSSCTGLRQRLRRHAAQRQLLARDVDGLAVQQGGDDRDVLLGVAARRGVRHAVHAVDHRRVRWPEAQREARSAHREGRRRGTVGLEHRMRRVGLDDRGAELDRRRARPTAAIGATGSPATALGYHNALKPSASACWACSIIRSMVPPPPFSPMRMRGTYRAMTNPERVTRTACRDVLRAKRRESSDRSLRRSARRPRWSGRTQRH